MVSVPPGAHPGAPYGSPMPAAPKSHTVRTVLIVLAVLAALCGVGAVACSALVGGGAAAVSHEQESRIADVTIGSCHTELGSVVYVDYTVVNNGTTSRTYTPSFDMVAADGSVIGQASDITSSLAPGKTYRGKAMGGLNDPLAKFTCKLVSA